MLGQPDMVRAVTPENPALKGGNIMQIIHRLSGAAWFFLIMICSTPAQTTWHVAESGSDSSHTGSNYWTNAFATISNAVGAAADGDTILVSNGTYTLAATINIAKGLLLRSWNNGALDPTNTIINGDNAVQCFYLNHSNVLVEGFSIINGNTADSGAGIYIHSEGGMARNCIITGCQATAATSYGGGMFIYNDKGGLLSSTVCGNVVPNATLSRGGGGVCLRDGGLISNCRVISNTTPAYGGGIIIINAGLVDGSVISDNEAAYGGGFLLQVSGTIRNSLIAGNTASHRGGGVFIYYEGYIDNCIISNNYAAVRGGGIMFRSDSGGLARNCLLVGNSASGGAGNGGGAYLDQGTGVLANCTIAANSAGQYAGGVFLYGGSYVTNCIIYENTALSYQNYRVTAVGEITGVISYSCTTPLPAVGDSNFTNAPAFVDAGAGNYRLERDSRGINEGLNQDWMRTDNAADLDGRTRIDRFSGRTDLGCYEYTPAGVMFRVR